MNKHYQTEFTINLSVLIEVAGEGPYIADMELVLPFVPYVGMVLDLTTGDEPDDMLFPDDDDFRYMEIQYVQYMVHGNLFHVHGPDNLYLLDTVFSSKEKAIEMRDAYLDKFRMLGWTVQSYPDCEGNEYDRRRREFRVIDGGKNDEK